MKQQCVVPDSDLLHGSTKYTTAQSKADALAKAFAEASDTDSLPADRQQFRREMEATFTHPVPHDSLAVNTPLTCTELRRALASIKKVKVSTGVDTVSYRMLKEAPDSFMKILLDFFQRCWDGGTIPAGWKHAIVVPIHKHGKPRKELGSYRPISLTSHLGKLYERVIKNRLEYHCESKKKKKCVSRVPGRLPKGTGCQRPHGETGWARREGSREEKGPTDVLLWHLPCLRPGLARQAATEAQQDRNFWQHVQLHQILPERQIDAGQVKGSHVDHQRNKYGRSSGIRDRPPPPPPPAVVQHRRPRRGHGSEGKGSADYVRRWLGDMDGHPRQTSPHKQLVCETQHETVPGSRGRGGPLYVSKWVRSLFPENGVRPIPHQHLSEHGGVPQGERTEHLCIERSQAPGCTLHSLGAYKPAGRAQRAERLPSPQRDQGAICSALGQHPQDPRERGAGPGALTPLVRTGSHAPPLENGSCPFHRQRGGRSATGPRAAAVRAAVPGVQRGRAPPVPPPHPARL